MTGDLTNVNTSTEDKSLTVSIVVPVLNEIEALPELLRHLSRLDQSNVVNHDIVLVDGGSNDGTVQAATQAGFRVIESPRGRARQMNAGANATRGDILLFLHADTRLPANALEQVQYALEQAHDAFGQEIEKPHHQPSWGRFDVRITGDVFTLKIVARMTNLRSRITGIATGDQAIFIHRSLFDQVGGFPDQPLMEDVELSQRLCRIKRPVCLRSRVVTSGRRWIDNGVWKTIVLMWQLRWAYWRGIPAEQLAERYK
ncbi:MAG: glycosyl transferase [Oceanospirillaceae bacterium]|nr:glycosyl transferase [Oceanospirillaceae bacterium]